VLYGHIIDEREFSRTHELFTPDAYYGVSLFGAGVHIDVEVIVALWSASEGRHRLAHHATNVVVP
jgi:hypothetical protein